MEELSTKKNVVQSLLVIGVLIAFLVPSAAFGWWGYSLTGWQETWGESIWEDSNWVGSLVFGAGITSAVLFVYFFASRMILLVIGEKTEGVTFNVAAKRVKMKTRSELHKEFGDTNPALHMFRDENVTVYSKKFRFTAHDGKTYEVHSNVETNEPLAEGETVEILYRKRNPQKAKIYRHLEFYTLVYLFLGAAITATVVGALMLELLD